MTSTVVTSPRFKVHSVARHAKRKSHQEMGDRIARLGTFAVAAWCVYEVGVKFFG